MAPFPQMLTRYMVNPMVSLWDTVKCPALPRWACGAVLLIFILAQAVQRHGLLPVSAVGCANHFFFGSQFLRSKLQCSRGIFVCKHAYVEQFLVYNISRTFLGVQVGIDGHGLGHWHGHWHGHLSMCATSPRRPCLAGLPRPLFARASTAALR